MFMYPWKELADSFSYDSKGKRENIRTFCSWKAEMVTFPNTAGQGGDMSVMFHNEDVRPLW